ncbi:MAG: AraC family transcriptional regulator, partial [Tissierellia bacterium]|nr:AraC family transcriptional regulator [Tissierellia bacterium]
MMTSTINEYLLKFLESMPIVKIDRLSSSTKGFYRMLPEYGDGIFQMYCFEEDSLLILVADFTPHETFEKITEVS